METGQWRLGCPASIYGFPIMKLPLVTQRYLAVL